MHRMGIFSSFAKLIQWARVSGSALVLSVTEEVRDDE